MAQPGETAAQAGTVVRRALAGKKGREHGGRGALHGFAQFPNQGCGIAREQAREPFQAVGRGKNHAHLVPGIGHGMAEGVDRRFGIGREFRRAREQHARGAERNKGAARPHGADAAGRGRVVAAAAGDRHAGFHAEACGKRRMQARGSGAAFHQARHVQAAEPGGGERGHGDELGERGAE